MFGAAPHGSVPFGVPIPASPDVNLNIFGVAATGVAASLVPDPAGNPLAVSATGAVASLAPNAYQTIVGVSAIGVAMPKTPDLDLYFQNMGGVLPGTVTFSRGTVATVYGASGFITYGPNNLLTQSNTFTNGVAWSSTNVALASGTTDPFGGSLATTATAGATNVLLYNGLIAGAGNIISAIWVRRRTGTGAISLSSDGSVYTPLSLTGSWQQFFVIGAGAVAGTSYVALKFATSGDAIDVYGATLSHVTYETAPRPQDQVITTTTAFYGVRFGYQPNPLTNLGLSPFEGGSQNLQINSGLASAWNVLSNGTVANTGVTAPDGISASVLATATASNGFVQANTSTTGAGTFMDSVFIKYGSGLSITSMTIGNTLSTSGGGTYGVSWSNGVPTLSSGLLVQPVANGWYRVYLPAPIVTSGSGANFVRAAFTNNGDTGYLFGVQLEPSSIMTSYMPTGSAAFTRNADVDSTSFAVSGVVSAAVSAITAPGSGGQILWQVDDGTANNRVSLSRNSAGQIQLDVIVGGVDVTVTAGSIANATSFSAAFRVQANDYAISLNGAAVVTGTGAMPTGLTTHRFGKGTTSTLNWNGSILRDRAWLSALGNGELQFLSSTNDFTEVKPSALAVSASGVAASIGREADRSITGVAATGAVAAVTPNVSIGLSGVAAVGAAASVGAGPTGTPGAVAATGVAAPLGKEIDVGLSAVAATGTAAQIGFGPQQGITGVSAHGAVSAVGAQDSGAPAAVSATGVAAPVSYSVSSAVGAIQGVGANGGAGVLFAIVPAGVAAVGVAAPVGLHDDSNVAIAGVAATGAAGAVVGGRSVNLVGVSAIGAAASLAITEAVGLTGVAAQGAVAGGVPEPQTVLTGVAAQGVAVAPGTQRSVALTGVAAVGVAGQAHGGPAALLSGVAATGAIASLATSSTTGALVGAAAQGVAGLLVPLVQVVSLPGVAATGAAGQVGPDPGGQLHAVAAVGIAAALGIHSEIMITGVQAIGAAGQILPYFGPALTQVRSVASDRAEFLAVASDQAKYQAVAYDD